MQGFDQLLGDGGERVVGLDEDEECVDAVLEAQGDGNTGRGIVAGFLGRLK